MKSESLGTSDELPLQEDGFAREKEQLREALKLKALKGSIVWELVACGKKSCTTCRGVDPKHGPYSYLHFYAGGKVKRKYLSKLMAGLLSWDKRVRYHSYGHCSP
jgi:hypothetical protein